MTGLEKFANDAGFQAKWRAVKLANKTTLANHLGSFEPSALLDAQCKRIHEYKRQHLNLLHAIALWQRIGNGEDIGAPRTFVSGGKAAPAYWMAKLIIRLAAGIGERLAADPVMRDQLRVLFVPDFSVKVAQRIYPAADLPEQISTAGLEASGTGNMKFTLNGALTIGTLDGANVEIRDAVGADHFFLFGLPAEQVIAEKRDGYHPGRYIHGELANALDLVASGAFSRGDKAMFEPLVTDLRNRDPFLVCADFEAYAAAQRAVVELWKSPKQWLASSIINVARSGRFSSDRSIDRGIRKADLERRAVALDCGMAPIPPVGKRGALESLRRDQLPATLGSPHPIAMILEQDGQFRIRDLVIDEREAKLESDRAAAKGMNWTPEQHYDLGKPTGVIHVEAKTREALIATITAMDWPANW